MKRGIFKLCLFLLLGAIINVAVAWGITLAHGTTTEIQQAIFRGSSNARPLTAAEEQWYRAKEQQGFLSSVTKMPSSMVRQEPQIGEKQSVGWRSTAFIEVFLGPGGHKWMIRMPNGVQSQATNTGQTTTCIISRCESGWPAKSFLLVFSKTSSSGRALPSCWGLFPKLNGYVVPVDPILSGFAINTIFYAAIAWLLFAAPGVIRRRVRAHRGRCVACGYDLRGQERGTDHNLCPECGAAITMPDSRKPTAESPP